MLTVCPGPRSPRPGAAPTQRCLPFMGWNLRGRLRGDGVTPSATTLIYCIDAEGGGEGGIQLASMHEWADFTAHN